MKVWEKSHRLVLSTHRATAGFPAEERYGLSSQIRRCAASIPTNIAEGCRKGGGADLARSLQIASGSASEPDYHLLLAHDLGLLEEDLYRRLAESLTEVRRILTSLVQTIRANA